MAAVVRRAGAADELPAGSSGGLVACPDRIGPGETIYAFAVVVRDAGEAGAGDGAGRGDDPAGVGRPQVSI